MSTQKTTTRNTVLVLMIVFAVLMRFVNYKFQFMSNFTPVGAIALFGGVYFTNKWKAYLVPLVALFASDAVLNYLYTSKFNLFYDGVLWVYITFAVIVFMGTLIKKVNVLNVALASLTGVLIHWLLIDLTWLYSSTSLYPHTWAGYGKALIAAIPFEKNMLLGDIVYGIILFGIFEFAKSKYVYLRNKAELAL